MSYSEVKEWLDKIVDNQKNREALEGFNSQIQLRKESKIVHVEKGIDVIADIMDIKLKKKTVFLERQRKFVRIGIIEYRGCILWQRFQKGEEK